MSRTSQDRIQDVLDNIHDSYRFRAFLGDSNPTIHEMSVRSIMQFISVIGEAVNHLPSDLLDDYPEIPWKRVIGVRHLIIHHYHGIDNDQIIEIVDDDLPSLELTLLRMKDRLTQPPSDPDKSAG